MRRTDGMDVTYDGKPAVSVLAFRADPDQGVQAVRDAGARATRPPFPTGSDSRIGDTLLAPCFYLELGGEADGAAQGLLDEAQAGAEHGRWGGVIAASGPMLDLIAARVTHPALALLVDPTPADRAAAVATVLAQADARRSVRVHEADVGGETERLQRLTEEVGRIAQALARMSGEGGMAPRARGGSEAREGIGGLARSSAAVRATVRARRLRGQFFAPELFADPAWDMLLDLYAAHLDQHRVAVSSLCIASAVPATTALRWIRTLTDHGIFVRRADPTDGRRVFIELSEDAARGMAGYFAELERQADGGPLAMVA